jgi:hypothetical protein
VPPFYAWRVWRVEHRIRLRGTQTVAILTGGGPGCPPFTRGAFGASVPLQAPDGLYQTIVFLACVFCALCLIMEFVRAFCGSLLEQVGTANNRLENRRSCDTTVSVQLARQLRPSDPPITLVPRCLWTPVMYSAAHSAATGTRRFSSHVPKRSARRAAAGIRALARQPGALVHGVSLCLYVGQSIGVTSNTTDSPACT